MDKIKEKLHIGSSRRKSEPENDAYASKESSTTGAGVGTIEQNRDSIDSELASMPPHERVAYLQEFEESDKSDVPKKGGLIERLIARGNKRTEEQLAQEHKDREEAQRKATHAAVGPGAGASAQTAAGPTTDTTIR